MMAYKNFTDGLYDERFKFTGKERDAETGYDYFGARYYMPLFKHWTKVDPLVDNYLHTSPYAYCNWNPIKFVDPDGEWVAVTSNDDSGTSYKIVGGTVDVGDCNVYVVGNDYDMDGVHHTEEFDYNPANSQRHYETIKQNDPSTEINLNIIE